MELRNLIIKRTEFGRVGIDPETNEIFVSPEIMRMNEGMGYNAYTEKAGDTSETPEEKKGIWYSATKIFSPESATGKLLASGANNLAYNLNENNLNVLDIFQGRVNVETNPPPYTDSSKLPLIVGGAVALILAIVLVTKKS